MFLYSKDRWVKHVLSKIIDRPMGSQSCIHFRIGATWIRKKQGSNEMLSTLAFLSDVSLKRVFLKFLGANTYFFQWNATRRCVWKESIGEGEMKRDAERY